MPSQPDIATRDAAARSKITTHLGHQCELRFSRYITENSGLSTLEYFASLVAMSKKYGDDGDQLRAHIDGVLATESVAGSESSAITGPLMKIIVNAYRENAPRTG